MSHSRSFRSRVLAIAATMLGLSLTVNPVLGQNSIHRNGFETKIGWIKGSADAPFEEIAHKIDDREPHSGRGSEYFELDAKLGKHIYYVYPIGKAPITDELRLSLWMRSNRPGMKILARVVLPKERDPGNLEYQLTTVIEGDAYQQAGLWQLMEISRPVVLAKKQQQLMINQTGRQIDFTGAYIDSLVINMYAGPGPTRVWVDDLESGPLSEGPFQTADRIDKTNPDKGASLTRPSVRASAVDFRGNRIVVGNKRMFFRGIRYTDTSLTVLRNAGFNTIYFDRNVNPALVREAGDLGMWIAPEFRVTNDDGQPLSADDIGKQIQRYADNDSVLFHRIGGVLAFENATMVSRATQAVRGVDAAHLISGDVWDGMMPYSRSLNLVGIHRFPLMTTLELPKYREWIEMRRRLANPGTFTWTWIQTHMPEWYSELLYNQNAQAAFKDPVGPQPEQVRLLAYTALAAGSRGLAFWSDRFLADSHQGRDRLLSCALLNQEIDMLEPLLVTVDEPAQWIDTSVKDVKAAVLRCNQGVLVLPIWQGSFSQFVPGQAAAAKLILTVPQVPKTMQAWEVSPGDVRGLKIERVDQGSRVTLPEFGLTSAIFFTADTALVGRLQDQSRARRQQAAQWSTDMAFYEYEKVVTVQTQLEQLGASIPEANNLLADAKRRLVKAQDLWKGSHFTEAYHEAQRALRPVRILMRTQWEKAVRGFDTPVASPYAVSFYTLPRHWQFMAQVKNATVGANQLRGGDFELEPERKQDSWKPTRETLDEMDLIVERVAELKAHRTPVTDPKKKSSEVAPSGNPIEGRQCAMLQVKPRSGKSAPAALERTHVSLTSADVKMQPGTLVQISGWINIPAPITASPDGVLMFDSAGGEPLAIRWNDPTPWKKYTVYRRVPASGSISVTLQLTGIGTAYFDDIRIEPLIPNN